MSLQKSASTCWCKKNLFLVKLFLKSQTHTKKNKRKKYPPHSIKKTTKNCFFLFFHRSCHLAAFKKSENSRALPIVSFRFLLSFLFSIKWKPFLFSREHARNCNCNVFVFALGYKTLKKHVFFGQWKLRAKTVRGVETRKNSCSSTVEKGKKER